MSLAPTPTTEKGKPVGNERQKRANLLWLPFAFACLAFLLVFAQFSSLANTSHASTINFTGQQLIMGDGGKNLPPYQFPAVIAAFGFTLAGLLLAVSQKRAACILSGLCGIGGIMALFVAKNTIANFVAEYPGGLVTVSFQEGFWLTAVLLIIAAIGQFKMAATKKNPLWNRRLTHISPNNPPDRAHPRP